MLHENEYLYETESNSSSDSFDSSNEFDSINYFERKIINSKYKLLIPEIYNITIHGNTIKSDPNIKGQFIVIQQFPIKYNKNIERLFRNINSQCNFYNNYYKSYFYYLTDNIIRNFSNIIKTKNYIKPEIGQIFYLGGGECVCVIKTFWIKIIQRTWKKIFKMRQNIKKIRHQPKSIYYKQISGKYPVECLYMPSIKGMLLL